MLCFVLSTRRCSSSAETSGRSGVEGDGFAGGGGALGRGVETGVVDPGVGLETPGGAVCETGFFAGSVAAQPQQSRSADAGRTSRLITTSARRGHGKRHDHDRTAIDF